MLARLPKPAAIAAALLVAWIALPTVSAALLGALIGDGSELGMLLRLGLLVAVIAGSKWLVGYLKDNPASRESLLTAGVAATKAGVAAAKAVPPLARTIANATRQLFDALERCVTYLRGCRWPMALLWFLLTLGIFILQAIPASGFFLMLLAAPLWSVVTINLGFAQLIVEPAMRKISPAWSLVGLCWFLGYAAVAVHGHSALDRLASEAATENSRRSLPFDQRTQSLVVVRGKFDDAPSAERLLMIYPLSVVYETYEDSGIRDKPAWARNGAPFRALRLGPPELCDSIADNAPDHFKTTVEGVRFCFYSAIEAPDLPVVRLRFAQEKLRIVGAEGTIDRITLTSGGDKRQFASVNAASYQYLPLPMVGCFLHGGDARWACQYNFLKESRRARPGNDALVGQSLSLEQRKGGS